MGSLDVGSYSPIAAAVPLLGIAAIGLVSLPRQLDLMSLGSEAAASRGVDVRRTEQMALLSASLATGAAVSLAGPVSFIGIVVPHLVRLVPDMEGPTFDVHLVYCDALRQSKRVAAFRDFLVRAAKDWRY